MWYTMGWEPGESVTVTQEGVLGNLEVAVELEGIGGRCL